MESNSGKNEPPSNPAGETQEKKKVNPIATTFGVVAAAFGVGELAFLRGTPGDFVRGRENVLFTHLRATGLGRVFFLKKGLQCADAGMKPMGLRTEIIGTLFSRPRLFFSGSKVWRSLFC